MLDQRSMTGRKMYRHHQAQNTDHLVLRIQLAISEHTFIRWRAAAWAYCLL